MHSFARTHNDVSSASLTRSSVVPRLARDTLVEPLARTVCGKDGDSIAKSWEEVAQLHLQHHAQPLGGTPDIVHLGKAVRYDVYLARGAVR